ncbi:MAG: DUF4831 family protein [Bacteroidales bacterium]|jgi:hypothetical protein|nr:DUF4831 family protein [Bacteroidales bacterium]
MKGVRYLILCGIYLLSMPVQTTGQDTVNEKKTKKIKESFYYALPQNYFTVHVRIDQTNRYKGPLAGHAGKVTGLTSVVNEDTVYYTIAQIDVEIHSQIDREHIYHAELKQKHATKYHLLYKELLLANYTLPRQSFLSEKQSEDKAGVLAQNLFPVYTADALTVRYDTTYVPVIVDSVTTILTPVINKRSFTKPTQQQAEEAMKTIETIREARWLLINGDHETDYSHLDRMLSELQKKEDDFLALFRGITQKEELSFDFTLTPLKKESTITLPLFYFSGKYGINDNRQDAQKVLYSLRLTANDLYQTSNTADKKQSVDTQEKVVAKGKSDFLYYRKPLYYTLSLYKGNDWVQDFGIYPVSQFGDTLPLPSDVISCKIDALTGALIYIETE